MENNQQDPVEVTATVGFQDNHGARRYRSIVYPVDHWENAMVMLFATNGWQSLHAQLSKTGKPLIYGVTFNFKRKT